MDDDGCCASSGVEDEEGQQPPRHSIVPLLSRTSRGSPLRDAKMKTLLLLMGLPNAAASMVLQATE